MTIQELDRWLAIAVVEVYHRTKHSTLRTTPLAAWTDGLMGTVHRPGPGLPARVADPQRFMLDFLPLAYRRIRREGILLHHIAYWSDVLRPWIGDIDRRMIVRYDPRDLAQIWLLGPDDVYYPLPYRHIGRPSITLWEHRRALKALDAAGALHVDESAIFGAIARMQAIADQAVVTTKKARRDKARRSQAVPKLTEVAALPAPAQTVEDEKSQEMPGESPAIFEDIEVWS